MSEEIDYDDIVDEKPDLSKSVKGAFGSFHTDSSYPVNYLLTGMNYKDLGNLEVAAEAFEFDQVNFDEMVQREIDIKRVNNEIVSQYLEEGRNNALFFPPLIVSIVAFDQNESPLHKYESCLEELKPSGKKEIFYKTWDRHFQLEIPKIGSGFDFYQSDQFGEIQVYKHAAKLNFDPNLVKFVVIDGQHRFKAIKEYWRRYPEQKRYLNVPVCICFSPKAMECNGPEDILDTLRNMFVTINNTGKKVSGHYIDLLNDQSLASQTVRLLANKWKKESVNPLLSKLQFVEWNQRADSKARRVNRVYSISSVSMLCEALRKSVFLNDKNYSYLHSILSLNENKESLEKFGDSIYSIQEDEFSHEQKESLYLILEKNIINPIEILLTKPSVYSQKIQSFHAAVSLCQEKSKSSEAGYPTFIEELSKFNDIDKHLHTEEAVSASKYFNSLIVENEHLENYSRLVFIQAYFKCWSAIVDCHHIFRLDLVEFTEVFIKSLEVVAFNESKMLFSKSRIYNQLTLYKQNKPNTTIFGKESWFELLMTTFVNEEQKSVIKEWLKSKPSSSDALDSFENLIENAKGNLVGKFQQEVMKDNLKNWKTKEFPLSFRRDLEDLETIGNLREIQKKLEEKSIEQVENRVDLLANILGVNPEYLLG